MTSAATILPALDELRIRPQWVVWRLEERNGKRTKVPYNARTGEYASTTDPMTWSAAAVAEAMAPDYAGIGFVVTPADPYVGVDLDKCRDPESGAIEPWAAAIVTRLASYTEITPSQHGLRVWVRGQLPPGSRRRGPIEMYDESRYFTVTGAHLLGSPERIESRDGELAQLHRELFGEPAGVANGHQAAAAAPVIRADDELVERARGARNGSRFAQLWSGDWQSAGYPSQSEADQALANLLAFWTGRDGGRVDRLFRRSALFRPKWDTRHFGDGRTYGQATIATAIASCSDVYQGSTGVGGFPAGNSFAGRSSAAEIRTHYTTDDGQAAWEPPSPLPSTTSGPPFPLGALPPPTREYVESVAEHLQVPRDLPAMLALSAVAAAVARKVEVVVKHGWIAPMNLYTVTVLPSGEGKSPVFSEMIRPLETREAAKAEAMAPAIRDAQTKRDILEERLKTVKSKAAKSIDAVERHQLEQGALDAARELAACHVPPTPRLLVDDITPEKTISMLAEQGGRLTVAAPEGGLFGLLAGRYSSNAKPNLDAYLKAHAGDAMRVDRSTRGGEFVQRPALTIALAVQPGVLHRLSDTPEFRENGLLARVLFSIPVSRVGLRDHAHAPPISEAARRTYDQAITALLDLPLPAEGAAGLPDTIKLRLSPEASRLLDDFRGDLEPQLRPRGRLEPIADWVNKLAEATARIAGLLHLLHLLPSTSQVSADTMKAALEIGAYLLEHALVAFRAMGRDRAFDGAVRVWAWVQDQGTPEVSQRDIFNAHDGTYRTMEDLRPSLNILIERGYLRPLKIGTGGRPSHRYQVNPLPVDSLGSGVQKVQKSPVRAPSDASAPSAPDIQGFESEEETL